MESMETRERERERERRRVGRHDIDKWRERRN
jgi:hypothetical protein